MKKENTKKFNMLQVFKLLFKILYNIFIIFCVLLILVVLVQRFTNSHGSIKGYRLFVVASGSMIPKYDIGEVVLCKEMIAEDIEIGNVIVYRGKFGDLNGKFIMHEVVGKRIDENGNVKISAKGLLNGQEDPEISENQIMGVVKYRSDVLTLIYSLAMNTETFIVIIFILSLNVFISFKSEKHDQKIAKLKEKNEKEIQVEQKIEEKNNEITNITNNLAREMEELEKIEQSEENNSDNNKN